MSEARQHGDKEQTRAPSPRGLISFGGLSARLLGLTILFVLIVETLVFLPSATNFRANWIETRIEQARIAVLALDAAPMREVSDDLSEALLMRAEVVMVAEIADGMRTQLLSQTMIPEYPLVTVEADNIRTFPAVAATVGAMFGSGDRWMLIIDPSRDTDHLEILVPMQALKSALLGYAVRIIVLSLIIAIAVGALIFLALYQLVVRPILMVTASVEQFRDNPRDWTRRLPETSRRDEIGRAQNALADLELAVQTAFRQRERLAQLGEAISKINHDLRNSLAAAQLVSESLATSDDPRVQRAAPRLERALERAINLAQATLTYGKGEAVDAEVREIALRPAIEEAVSEALAGFDAVEFHCEVGPHAVRADADHLHRIIVNIARNAAQAMTRSATTAPRLSVIETEGAAERITLHLCDNGPGIPDKVRANLFHAFSGAGSREGTGLGLAIARELAEGMGAELTLEETGPDGTVFRLILKTG